MKGCVNDVSECRNNCRRNGLKEMRWNRIKRTSSRMTERMSLETSASESGEKYVNKFMFAGKMCLIDCGVENCAVRFVILLMKNVPKSSAVKS